MLRIAFQFGLLLAPHALAAETGLACASGHASEVTALAWAPDGRLGVSGDTGGVVLVWEAETGRVLQRFRSGNGARVNGVALGANSRRVAIASTSTVVIHDIGADAPTLKHETGSPGEWFTSVVFSPDGRALGAAHSGGITVLDASTGAISRSLTARGPSALAFSPDGEWLAAQTGEIIRIWSLQTGVEVQSLPHPGPFAFSSDSRWFGVAVRNPAAKPSRFVTQGRDGKWVSPPSASDIEIYDVQAWRRARRLSGGHIGDIVALAFDPDSASLHSLEIGKPMRALWWGEKGEVLGQREIDGADDSRWTLAPGGARYAATSRRDVTIGELRGGAAGVALRGLTDLGASNGWRLLRVGPITSSAGLTEPLLAPLAAKRLPQGLVYYTVDVDIENHRDEGRSFDAPNHILDIGMPGTSYRYALTSLAPGVHTDNWRLGGGKAATLRVWMHSVTVPITSIRFQPHQTLTVRAVFVGFLDPGNQFKVEVSQVGR